MIFWDSSALVPLLLEQESSGRMRAKLLDNPVQVVWWATTIECASAISRVYRQEEVTRPEVRRAQQVLQRLAESWNEVLPFSALRERAEGLLRRHPLRAADALQLAAALTWALDRPRGLRFLSLDARLNDAADREGFTLVEA